MTDTFPSCMFQFSPSSWQISVVRRAYLWYLDLPVEIILENKWYEPPKHVGLVYPALTFHSKIEDEVLLGRLEEELETDFSEWWPLLKRGDTRLPLGTSLSNPWAQFQLKALYRLAHPAATQSVRRSVRDGVLQVTYTGKDQSPPPIFPLPLPMSKVSLDIDRFLIPNLFEYTCSLHDLRAMYEAGTALDQSMRRVQ